MARQLPLRLDDGRIKQFKATDDLPVQDSIDDLYKLMGKLVFTLYINGITVSDPDLINLLTTQPT